MPSKAEEYEQGHISYEELNGKEANPLPWIEKYLHLADLLIGRRKAEDGDGRKRGHRDAA